MTTILGKPPTDPAQTIYGEPPADPEAFRWMAAGSVEIQNPGELILGEPPPAGSP